MFPYQPMRNDSILLQQIWLIFLKQLEESLAHCEWLKLSAKPVINNWCDLHVCHHSLGDVLVRRSDEDAEDGEASYTGPDESCAKLEDCAEEDAAQADALTADVGW